VPETGCGRTRAAYAPSASFARLCRRIKWLSLGIGLALLLTSASLAQTDVITDINVQGNRRIPS
jgi:outer membrane protein insertion porin family